ncbi:hypothetical protein ACJMK2_027944 [Sinanodonta woodiana]|uniref:E3 ubiquitin-protein ligase rnf213-alpha-like n=1 Tax=Sinanodonta woodiana TaxID=1069815 RepID=A0ABD3X915_SINWO
MKCGTCQTELCDGDQYCNECGTAVTNADVILCSGKRPDGTPCGAELQKDFCSCMECGQNVDQALFQKMQIECLGVMKDGSLCRKLLKEDDKFCFVCATPRDVTPTSNTEVVSTSSTIDSAASYAQAGVFGMHAKLDGGNLHEGNKENVSASVYPSLTLTPGNRSVFGFNAPMDGEDREDEISGQPLLSGHLFPMSGSTSGNLNVFNLEGNIYEKHTGLFPSSSSSDPVAFHENDLHYDPEDEMAALSSSGESASQNNACLEKELSNVTLSEEKGDELLSKDGTDVKSDHIRVDEKHSDDSSPDSSDVDCNEDEDMNPASPESFQMKGKMLRLKRKKKPKKHKLKRERKKKKLESVKVGSNTQESDLQQVQMSVTAVSHSVLLIKSVDATADQMGKGSSQSTEKGKKATSGDVEKRRENTNKGQVQKNIESHDNVSIPEKVDDRDSQMVTTEKGKNNTVEKEPSLSSTGEKGTDFDRMEYDQSINAALSGKKNEQPTVELKKVPGKKNTDQIDSSKDGNNPDQTANRRSNRNAAPHKDPNVKVENVSHQVTEKGKTDSNQSQESKETKNINLQINNQANGSNAVKTESRERIDTVRVYFHALLSPEFNFTSADKVVVKFEVPSLGGWKSDEHSPETLRNTEDGYVELKLLMNIPKEYIQTERGLKYKYVVIKDRSGENPRYIWENYHYESSSKSENRTLSLKPKAKSIDEWHQYDGVVYPPKPEENFLKKIGKRVVKFFGGTDNERHKEDLHFSLLHFQPELFHVILKGTAPQVPIDEAVIQLEELYLSMRRVYYIDRRCFYSDKDFERQVIDSILAPILKSFENISLHDWKESAADAERRMSKAVSVLSAVGSLKLDLNQKEQTLLAKGLLVRPTHEDKKCYDLESIDKYIPKNKKKPLGDFLIGFIEAMAKTARNPHIFLVMPLYHFLTDQVQPFQSVPYNIYHDNREPKWWGIAPLSKAVSSFKTVVPSSWTVPFQEIVTVLHPLFELDYLLPRTIMAMLKLEDMEGIIKIRKIPREVCAACLVFYVKTTKPNPPSAYQTEPEKKVSAAIDALLDVCKGIQLTDENSESSITQAKILYKISSDLLIETRYTNAFYLLRSAVHIFLHSVAQWEAIQKAKEEDKRNTRQQSEHMKLLDDRYNQGVKQWFNIYQTKWRSDLKYNLEQWNSIVAPQSLLSETIRDAWNSQIQKDLVLILKREFSSAAGSITPLIDLYCTKVDTFQPCVQTCLNQLAFEGIARGYDLQAYQFGETAERVRYGKLLSDLFTREWKAAMDRSGMEKDRTILHHILTWTPFSQFLNMFYGNERTLGLLSDVCHQELGEAISVIDQKVHALRDGSISFRDLDKIKPADSKFQELAVIVCEKSDAKKEKSWNVVTSVKIRQKEVDGYFTQKKYVATLMQLCRQINSVELTELDRTLKFLDEKKDICIKDICQPANVEIVVLDEFQPEIKAFSLSSAVISVLELLHTSFRSNIFLNLWHDIGQSSKASTVDEVIEQVWKPVYSKMNQLTDRLVSGEILFAEIEHYLGNIYRVDYDKMVDELRLLNVPEECARERVKQLQQLRQMEACVDGAKTILNVAKAYDLEGDFEVIKTIASQENAADKKMKEFDDSLLKTCEFLKDLTSEKTKCLDHFIYCKNLVQWLRESMKGGLKELKVFVDLASISAGEGDMEIAKVNCLHAATTGYAPLIFDLEEDSGYKTLLDKCQILWKELKADPKLPEKLLDTNRHLEWLKTVKQAHGSVEVTSLAQAEAINSKGIFCVGTFSTAKNTTMGLDLQNTLQLTVPDHDMESQGDRQYTFEQLQDLQSRLMLVAGRAEQGKDDVDRFMLVSDSVLRLANVFIKLNSSGCVLFKHWQTKFLCDPECSVCAFIESSQEAKPLKAKCTSKDDVTTIIPKIARFMESCLDKWLGHINQKRSKYLELNYFTTDQLVILQQELVKVGPNQGLDNKIYPLLSAVKENCTYEDLVDAMKKASEDLKVDQMEVDEKCEEMEVHEDEEYASDQSKENEVVQNFIKEMIRAGYSSNLAEAALRHVKPDEIIDGIIWCGDHLEQQALIGEKKEDTEMEEGDQQSKELIPFEGWNTSNQSVMTIAAEISSRLEMAKGDMEVDQLIENMEVLWEEFLASVSSSVSDYLSVEHLGLILKRLAEKDQIQFNRPFPPSFAPGMPNLIICPKADVLSTVLSIYMMDANQPLPQADEVLMCTPQTTLDELYVFLRRTMADTSTKIHCLVNSDLLDFEVSDRGEKQLEQYMQQTKHLDLQYRLVVVCSAENEFKSRIITALDKFRRPPLPIPDIHHIADYVRRKLQVKEENTAASVDFDNSTVRVVKSWRAGVGKSLYVKRRDEELMQKNPHHKMTDLVNIPIQEKEINISQVTQILLSQILLPGVTTPRIFHLDIAHEVQEGLDFFLFNLLILGCLTDKSGYVWRRSSRDLYLVETVPILEFIQARKGGSTSYAHHIFDFLPFLTCRSPQESLDIISSRQMPRDFKQEDPQFDIKEFTSPIFQRPYQYLSRLDQGRGINDVNPNVPWGTPADCLNVLLRHCGVPDPSWAELHHFVWFLNTQLIDFEKSNFCCAVVAEDLPGFSKFVLRFLIQMSKDFSTRSLLMSEESHTTMMKMHQEVGEEEVNKDEGEDDLAQYQMRRTWESSPHPYLFFNPDGHTITFLGFNIERRTGNLIDQQTKQVLDTAIMPQNLYDSLVRNRVPIQEDFDSLPRKEKIERLCLVMGNDKPYDPDDTYELTTDNVKKILAIYMRFRCDIPVIIMGETGCGKTRLVKFLCALQTPPGASVKNMILMKVHGGTTTADIKRKVEEARKIAEQNTVQYGPHMYTVLFFDEANTTEAIGMIKEIMCDKSMEGNLLDRSQSLKFVAACNPYKKHSEDLIKRLEQAGLGYHVDADKTTDRLGRVPMRRLVYRVQPLPQSLLPLVWDFGQLNTQIEDLYIRQMVRRYIRNSRLPDIPGLIEVISGVLTASQDFMRDQKDECSFVSLRDVERVLNVMSWLYAQSQEGRTLFKRMNEIKALSANNTNNIEEKNEDEEAEMVPKAVGEAQNQDLNDITRSLVLALGVCYHACLKNREEYRTHVAPFFRAPCNLPCGPDQIEQEISTCQDVFLENVQLDKNIAKNTALKENVFMMVISIELRIPLFLVGKPGSSKSLAKTIVADAMQGNAAHKDLFREFKQVQMVSFQCSPLSTPDGIMGTFRHCAQFQKDKDLDRFVSVVVLDEVGLAEDSPRMPLKTLHPLLEDGCQGDEEPELYKKVAFIGISNWALDPAKMNRGILVQREVPDLEELMITAEGICVTKNHVYKHVKPFIEPLAKSYLDLFGEASVKLREFFGLRDFYSLMKMIYSFVDQTNKPPTWYQLLHSIKRNFGGLDTINPIETFASRLTMVDRDVEYREGDPDCKTAGLIEACLYDTNNIQSESRYLLLLTENYGALTILQQLIPTNNIITIFGSSFPKDQEYTQVCRNINRIKVCMETGNTVVLLNLENLYESLYDALNQYYVNFGGERYVDLGLGTHRVKCRVHKNFRLIVVAEKDVVYKKFPIPLINRLEKHFLTVNTILTREQSQLAEELEKWAKDFSTETVAPIYMQRSDKGKSTWSVGEIFMGYHADTCSAIILHVWQRLQNSGHNEIQKVLEEAKRLLLWCATPDAVVRLERCDLDPQEKIMLKQVYMREQCHENLAQYLHFKIVTENISELFAQITTHSKLLSTADKSDIHQAVGISPERIALETLQSFDTEQQFSRKIRSFMESNPEEKLLLMVQCDSGDTSANLVASAIYCIVDEYQQLKNRRTSPCHVIFIIQLPRIAGGCFTGFQCGLWHSAHIDDLRAQDEEMPSIMEMLGKSVGTLMERAVSTKPGETADMEIEEVFRTNRFAMKINDMKTESVDTEMPSQAESEGMEWESKEGEKLPDDHDLNEGHELQDVINESIDHKLNVRSLILSCVQPALAMVKDKEESTDRSTRRIELMLYLLHQNPIEDLPTFLHGLSCHIAILLKEKEKKYSYKADNWLSSEAARPENINKAGTFRRSCIQYLESKISPILAGIIAHIDTNHNLDIIHSHITPGDWKARLWLQILSTPGAIQLQYSDLQSPTRQQELNEVVVKTTGCEGQMFTAVMPFSWLIYEEIDGIWRTAQENQEEEVNMKVEKVIGLVKETKLGQMLETQEGNISLDDICCLYAQDFTYMVYLAQTQDEHELVLTAIKHTSAIMLKDTSPSILAHLVSIHESHNKIVQHLRYFWSINQVWPECAAAIRTMQVEKPDNFLLVSDQFTLAILGLCLLIEQLKPPDNNYLTNAGSRLEWLQKLCNYRPVIEKGLALYSSVSETRVDRAVLQAKQLWTRITVVKLCIEHMMTSDKEAEKHGLDNVMPLWVMLGDSPDLKQLHSLEMVEKFLKLCNRAAITKLLGQEQVCCYCEDNIEGAPVVLPCKDSICIRCYHDLEALGTKKCPKCSKSIPSEFNLNAKGNERKTVQKFKEYQSRCNSFFMDVVSQLCFADNTAPSDQVVDKLLGYIIMTTTPGKQGKMETRHLTKELTIFNDCVDPNPVFRSFLLQLLLRMSEEKVLSNLEKYFSRAHIVIGEDNIDIVTHTVQLCQLVVQCLEDSFYLSCTKEDKVALATDHLIDADHDIKTSPSMLQRLYGIAKARFGLAVTAKQIHEIVLKKGQIPTAQQRRLIDQAATLCEGDCKWPKMYFIKYLCRCYGVDSYQAVCRKTDVGYLRWIKYQPAEDRDKVREVSDRYIVCGPLYTDIREAVTKVVLGEGTDQLDKAIKDTRVPEKKEILLCLALHREITMSRLQEVGNSKITQKTIDMLQKYCSEADFMKNKEVAQKILQNTYGVQSPILTVTPGLDLKQQGVLCLLMHFDLVLRNINGNRSLVQPLIRLATQPQTMKDAFIPTMPQDDVQEIREVLLAYKGKDTPVFYRCPNGHPYVIGDCGRPYTVSKCPKCGSEIGGQLHEPHPGNVVDPGVDRTESGHILGRAENRTQIGPERTLTPAYCGIIRLLTHLTMMLGANVDSLAMSQFIKPEITEDMVSQFLWQHIEHDLDDLHRTLGKSLDDVFIIMHSILYVMMENYRGNSGIGDGISGLTTKKARNKWEKKFSEIFVAPALQKMEDLLKKCSQQLAEDKRLGSDPLLCLLYEISQPQEKIPLEMLQENPAMWRFRSQITMDHLHHEFEIRMTGTKKHQRQHTILQLFLKEDHHLRAIRYLPSILKLQRILFQKYQRKLDRAEASTITVGMLRKESDGDELPKLLDEYAEVWDLVRENLVFVPKEYRRRHIDDSTPVSQLLPTASDAGQCAYSVLEFLFRKQNDFLDSYYLKAKRRVAEIPSVKVRDITPAHLISYHPEQDILPLVLANCNYSFEVGKGTTIEYNFANLERQIVDRFLFGKCFIQIEIELMVYRAEYTNATVFRKLQEKVPQESLSSGVKHKISEEFRSLPDLCQALDNLDIAISFLKSIGGNQGNNLDKFMVETLKMEQSLYSPKAKQICQYQHAKSLWLLLSLEKTKQLALHNQMIFDGLPEQFHHQLSAELTEQVMASLQPLSLERLEVLLELMFECIILVISVQQNPDDEDYVDAKEKKFKDYLFALVSEEEVELLGGLVAFPDDVLSKFCVATWTLAYQCLQEKKRQRY